MTAAPLTIECEGSGFVGHPVWRGDLLGEAVMCQMCGQAFGRVGAFDRVPFHARPDIVAMLDRATAPWGFAGEDPVEP